jgi:hypothetical protein
MILGLPWNFTNFSAGKKKKITDFTEPKFSSTCKETSSHYFPEINFNIIVPSGFAIKILYKPISHMHST